MLVDTRCGRLFVDIEGEGPDVVLWPSLLMDSGMWHHQRAALAAAHRVIGIDPPGHGRSEPTRRRYSLEDCVGAALTVLDAVDARNPAWCGLSWGGMVGMRIAARHTSRLSSLVLADTSARASPLWQRLRFGALTAMSYAVGPIPPLVTQAITAMFAHPSEHADDVRRAEIHMGAMDRRSIAHAVAAVLLFRDDVSDRLPGIAVPTLVLVGQEDSQLPVSESQRLARAIPDARLVTLPRAGHLSCMEAPEQFTDELVRFLAHTSSAAARPVSGHPTRPGRSAARAGAC